MTTNSNNRRRHKTVRGFTTDPDPQHCPATTGQPGTPCSDTDTHDTDTDTSPEDILLRRLLSDLQPCASTADPQCQLFTTDDIVRQLAPMLEVSINRVAAHLIQEGFDTIHQGGQWLWMVRLSSRT